jgi:Cu+-exporting ATPase
MALMATTSVLIVACPCALALSLPYAFGNVLRLYGRRGLYLKNTDVIEKMTEVDTLVFDKTGTLSHAQAGLVQWEGEALSAAEWAAVKTLCEHSTHPLSRSIHASLEGTAAYGQLTDFEERVGQGIIARVAGQEWRLGSATWLGARAQTKSEDPLQTRVYLAKEGRLLGHFNLQKNYREGLEALFAELSKRYDLYLLSGDGDAERERLQPLFGSADRLRFKQSPTDKLAFVQKLQAQGRKVLMVGDGLNDAGALQQSWVGLAIAEDIHSFTPASDAILDAQQFPHLGQLLAFSHRARRILRTSFLLSLSYNAVGLSVAVRGLLTPLLAAILMPLSSVTVVGFVVLASSMAGRIYLPQETNAKTDLDHL